MQIRSIFVIFCLSYLIAANDISYGFEGFTTQQFSNVLNKYPISALARTIENMENDSEMILRPFNPGATKNYLDHSALGKNTNVKGKSCYLDDETLNGKITYIQTNEYTGRNRDPKKFIHIGKYITKDKTINEVFNQLASQKCQQWKDASVDEIKQDLTEALKEQASDNPQLQDILQYANARFMYKVNIEGELYLTTQFVTIDQVQSNSDLPVTQEVCQDGHCQYHISDSQTTSVVKVLAYNAYNFNTCKPVVFQLVADMDIMTIHFPEEAEGKKVDLKKYFGSQRKKYCQQSFKMAFGISPNIEIMYNYIQKLMQATAEWGLIRHSAEALNLCFTQPFETQKYYIKLAKSLLGRAQITIIYEGKDSKIIPKTIRQWVLEGKCTPLNPSWIFENDDLPEALLWNQQERQSILEAQEFKDNNCPTYETIEWINRNGAHIPLHLTKGESHLRTYYD